MKMPYSVSPKRIRLGLDNGVGVVVGGERVITLTPVIKAGRSVVGYRVMDEPISYKTTMDELVAYKITISGEPPLPFRERVIDGITTLSFETTVLDDGDPYDVRWFFEHVEWKQFAGTWKFGSDALWDEFVSERVNREWPIEIEFLGIATKTNGPSRDERVREILGDEKYVLGCWYRLDRMP